MAARAGMANLILRLRALTEASASDYSIGVTTYWSDDQLQDILDGTRKDYRMVALEPQPELGSDGFYDYFDYKIPPEIGRDFEEAGSGSIWAVKKSDGTLISSSDYTVNYRAGLLRFNTDQAATFYFLDVRTFNLNAAAYEVWQTKAAHAVAGVDWKSDNHDIKGSQEYEHCMQMAERFRRMGSGWQSTTMVRVDETW
jgi:hypothetical protein